VDLFTAADLHGGLVRYDHDAGGLDDQEGSSDDDDDDRFAFAVCVELRCADGVVDVRVTAAPPAKKKSAMSSATVVSRHVVVDRPLGSAVVTPNHLNASCASCSEPFDVVYSVTSSANHGHLVRAAGQARINETLASFSQRDLDLGRVIYRHVDSAHLSDSVQLSASVRSRDDDVIWSSVVRLEIEIKPNVSELLLTVAGNISVVEGEKAFVTENQLQVQHGGDADDVEFVVLRLPVYGRIQVISGQELRARTSFLLSEVSNISSLT